MRSFLAGGAANVAGSDEVLPGSGPRHPWASLGTTLPPAPVVDPLAPVLGLLGAAYVGVVVPAQRSDLNSAGSLVQFVLVAAIAFVAMLALPRRWWTGRLGIAAAAAAVAFATEGKVVALWLPVSLLLAVWVGADRPPVPLERRPAAGATLVAVVGSYLALRAGTGLSSNWQPLSVLAVTALVVLASVGRSTSVGTWLRDSATRFATTVLAWILSAVVLVIGSVMRVVGFLVLAGRRSIAPGWGPRTTAAKDPRSVGAWGDRRLRVRRWVHVAVAVGLVALVVTRAESVAPGLNDPDVKVAESSAFSLGVGRPGDPIPAAYKNDDWYPELRRDLAWVTSERVAWRPMAVQRVLDVVTPTVSVVDRRRSTWTAPECDCKRVTAWLYGGSAAFGLGQRDEHTIASELARLAAEDDVVLDVQNRGIPGDMHWRESTRFSWDLSVDPKPDLVLFYDGAEEVSSELGLERRGLGNVLAPFDPFLTDLYDEVVDAPAEVPDPPPGVTYVGWPTIDDEQREPGHLATERYERSRTMSTATAAEAGLPIHYYWQPNRYASDAASADLSAAETARKQVFEGAAESVPTDGVVNLSDVLEGQKGPFFSDDTNHNEDAARIIAAAIWADLRDEVRRLGDGG